MSEEENQGSLEDLTLKVKTGGNNYVIPMADFSAMDELDYEKATGRDLMAPFMTGEVTTVLIAGLVWLYRRRFEKTLTFDSVARQFKFGDLQTLEIVDAKDDEVKETEGLPPGPVRPEG